VTTGVYTDTFTHVQNAIGTLWLGRTERKHKTESGGFRSSRKCTRTLYACRHLKGVYIFLLAYHIGEITREMASNKRYPSRDGCFGITVPPQLKIETDQLRGEIPRSRWVEHALRMYNASVREELEESKDGVRGQFTKLSPTTPTPTSVSTETPQLISKDLISKDLINEEVSPEP
jgi:hypothetical protein